MSMLRRRIGSLRLMAKLGEGGMSEVYLGLHSRTREQRAVKIVAKRATQKASFYVRFLREIDIIRALLHPRIVRLYESGELDDCYYYVMDYIAGGSLAQRLALGRIPLSESLGILEDVCQAMSHAHGAGIIHRDLKPGNILLDRAGAAFVSDFGIAKILGSQPEELTRSNEVMGTVAYLAPEQRVKTKEVDRRADVFAIGAIFYEMLMGFPPLGRFPWPADTQPSFPEALQQILERCLALNPADRFSDAGSLLAETLRYRQQAKQIQENDRPDSQLPSPITEPQEADVAPPGRLDGWVAILRTGATGERLAAVQEMCEKITAAEMETALRLYRSQEEKVQWGLIRVFGGRRLLASVDLIVEALSVPLLRECAIEAIGNIGAEKTYDTLRRFVGDNGDAAFLALTPLARTGKQRSVPLLAGYLDNETTTIRKAAVRALAMTESQEALLSLKTRLAVERDDSTRHLIRLSMRSLESRLRQNLTLDL